MGTSATKCVRFGICQPTFSPILIVGPEGVGKDALARTIYEWSGQPDESKMVAGRHSETLAGERRPSEERTAQSVLI